MLSLNSIYDDTSQQAAWHNIISYKLNHKWIIKYIYPPEESIGTNHVVLACREGG